ncbi:MAG: hypothetical protein WCC64_18215 [Aliidongia sp.]
MSRFLRRVAAAAVVSSLGLANLVTQNGYIAGSASKGWGSMLSQLRELTTLPPHVPVAIGLQDFPGPQLVGLYTKGHPAWNLGGTDMTQIEKRTWEVYPKAFEDLTSQLLASYHPIEFDLGPDEGSHLFRRFEPQGSVRAQVGYVVLPARDESVVNGSQSDRPQIGHLYAALQADQHNTLVLMDTDLGHIIFPGKIQNIALWQHEPDFAGSPGGLQGIGRHLLFEVLNPVPGSRLLLDYTTGGLAGQGVALPPADVIGTERLSLGFEGRGAGRVLSAVVTPREIDGHYYIAIDMGADAMQFRTERHGLAALYNTRLRDDPRYLIGFARNISLLAPDQVAAIVPPSAIASFPAGLLAPGLLFSGVAEDGWLADKAWFELSLPGPSNFIHVTGDIPGYSPKILEGVVRVFADGQLVSAGKAIGGVVDLTIPIPEASGPREITFDLTGVDRLPEPDGRLVSIHLTSLALGKSDGSAEPKPIPQFDR